MTPEQFVKTFLPFAIAVEKKKGFHRLIIMAQAAQESGWGSKAVGNNFFGIKDTDGINGNEQLIVTTEYSKSPHTVFPVIIRKLQVKTNRWRYTIKDWFRKYSSAELSFNDHCDFFERNPRYKEALKYKMNPERFFEEIQKAGYATDPEYATNLKAVMKSVIKRLPK
ncbi:glycoside hydrolase family 73 protein [Flavobacterium sp. 25HG05S-40]|uniref:glycoside hydrolase family 73 protein n=1 Tax=Flavobacterium sp. 25HG05S-40 TaxID=3458682 RepID=UPI004043FEEA